MARRHGLTTRFAKDQVRAEPNDRKMAMEQGYGIKCEPEASFQLDYLPHPSNDVEQSPEGALDMDLTGFLDMEETALSGKIRR